MAITPITNYMPVRNSGINFSGKNRKQEQYLEEYPKNSSSMSGLKKVPVIVLLAMSPVNMQNVQAKPLPEPVTTTISAPPSFNEPETIGQIEVITDNPDGLKAKYYFNKLDLDGDKRTAEILVFRFEYKSSTSNTYNQLDAVVKGITPNPINDKGHYLLEFECQTEDGNYLVSKVTAVPENFGKHILKIARSSVGENLGIIKHKNHLVNEYNYNTVYSPSFITGETNVTIEKGKITRGTSIFDGIREKIGHVVRIR